MEGGIPMAEYGGDQAKITPGDLTERFGRLTGESNSPTPMESQGAALLGVVVAAAMMIAFVLGRRAGRKKSTFVEVVRL